MNDKAWINTWIDGALAWNIVNETGDRDHKYDELLDDNWNKDRVMQLLKKIRIEQVEKKRREQDSQDNKDKGVEE